MYPDSPQSVTKVLKYFKVARRCVPRSHPQAVVAGVKPPPNNCLGPLNHSCGAAAPLQVSLLAQCQTDPSYSSSCIWSVRMQFRIWISTESEYPNSELHRGAKWKNSKRPHFKIDMMTIFHISILNCGPNKSVFANDYEHEPFEFVIPECLIKF